MPDYRVYNRDTITHSNDRSSAISEMESHPKSRLSEKISGTDTPIEPPVSGLESHPSLLEEIERDERHPIEGPWILPRSLWIIVRYRVPKILLHGLSIDVHAMQSGSAKDAERIHKMHELAKQYDNEVGSVSLIV